MNEENNNLTIENLIKTDWFNQFDKYQQEEIRLGLEDNLDVSNYLDFELDWDEMQAIRLELKKEKQKKYRHPAFEMNSS